MDPRGRVDGRNTGGPRHCDRWSRRRELHDLAAALYEQVRAEVPLRPDGRLPGPDDGSVDGHQRGLLDRLRLAETQRGAAEGVGCHRVPVGRGADGGGA